MGSWTDEARRPIEQVFIERLEEQLEPGERLTIEGEDRPEEIEARLVLQGGKDGARVVIEARVSLSEAGLEADAARYLALDAVDLVLLEYLDSGRSTRFAGVWEGRELEQKPVSVRAERTFPDLEEQADTLLDEMPG